MQQPERKVTKSKPEIEGADRNPGGSSDARLPGAREIISTGGLIRGRWVSSNAFVKAVLGCSDFLFLALAFGFSLSLRTGDAFTSFLDPNVLTHLMVYCFSIMGCVAVIGGYRLAVGSRNLNYVAEFLLAVGMGTFIGLSLIYIVLSKDSDFGSKSRAAFIGGSILFLPPALILRFLLTARRRVIEETRPYLVIGSREEIAAFKENFRQTGLRNPLVGCEIDTPGALENLCWREAAAIYTGVIVTDSTDSLDAGVLEQLVRLHFNELRVSTMNSFYANMWRQVPVLRLDLSWAIKQDFHLARSSPYRYFKNFFDVVMATALLLLLLPLILIIAFAVRIGSAGPVIFAQPRVGRNQKVFTLYKFRTMHVRDEQGELYTQENDVRITRVGALLRKLRLDELPQLYNVLLGDMSLIGPRAEWVRLVDNYEKEIPCYHLRHLVKPGITGWAQLNHRYGENLKDAVEKLKYDLYYIKYYSLVLDIEITLKTALAIIFARGK